MPSPSRQPPPLLRLSLALLLLAAATPEARADDQTLAEARRGFVTKPRKSEFERAAPLPEPPADQYVRIKYKSPAGELLACVTPDPRDGKRRPAILWCHGGFGGLSDYYWKPQDADDDQTPRQFVDAGYVVMLPSWRGENDNPGNYEMFLGEVDDAAAALEHLAALPHVDPKRIYVVGHSTGATIAMLLACSTDKARAVFAFGGAPNLATLVEDWGNMMPFDPADKEELRLRSPVRFVKSLKTPVVYVEGEESGHALPAKRMGFAASMLKAPFSVALVERADHFDLLQPVTRYLAARLFEDAGERFSVPFTAMQFQAAFDKPIAPAEPGKPRKAEPGYPKISPAAVTEFKRVAATIGRNTDTSWVFTDGSQLGFKAPSDDGKHLVHEQDGLRVAVPIDRALRLHGQVIEFGDQNGKTNFYFRNLTAGELAALKK
jgi:dienelactone hydrolase